MYPKQGGVFQSDFELPITIFSEGQYKVKATYLKKQTEYVFGVANDFTFDGDNTGFLHFDQMDINSTGQFEWNFAYPNGGNAQYFQFNNSGTVSTYFRNQDGGHYLRSESTNGVAHLYARGTQAYLQLYDDDAALNVTFLNSGGNGFFRTPTADGNFYYRDADNVNVSIYEMGDGQLSMYDPTDLTPGDDLFVLHLHWRF